MPLGRDTTFAPLFGDLSSSSFRLTHFACPVHQPASQQVQAINFSRLPDQTHSSRTMWSTSEGNICALFGRSPAACASPVGRRSAGRWRLWSKSSLSPNNLVWASESAEPLVALRCRDWGLNFFPMVFPYSGTGTDFFFGCFLLRLHASGGDSWWYCQLSLLIATFRITWQSGTVWLDELFSSFICSFHVWLHCHHWHELVLVVCLACAKHKLSLIFFFFASVDDDNVAVGNRRS